MPVALVLALLVGAAGLTEVPDDNDLECEEMDVQMLQKDLNLESDRLAKLENDEKAEKPVLVLGATQAWGLPLYTSLRKAGKPVRTLLNVSEAKNLATTLGCSSCDEKDGVFVIEFKEPKLEADPLKVMSRALSGVRAVISPVLPAAETHIFVNLIKAVAKIAPRATFVMISNMNTTQAYDMSTSHNIIRWETELQASNVPYAIVKTCRREEGAAEKKELIVAPGDHTQLIGEFEGVEPLLKRFSYRYTISNADVARVAEAWAELPPPTPEEQGDNKGLRRGVRLDLCAKDSETPTVGMLAVHDALEKSWQPWQVIDYKKKAPEDLKKAPILVTGATGRTGSAVYKLLKKQGVPVRAYVRNQTKARKVLGCSKCDESEGIFIGDITLAEPFMPAVWDIRAMISTHVSDAKCDATTCWYPKTREIDMWGTFQTSFGAGESAAKSGIRPHLIYVGAIGHGLPVDKFLFNKMGGEVNIMSLGMPFSVVKPCALTDKPAGKQELLVGPVGVLESSGVDLKPMSRNDLAKVLVQLALSNDLGERGQRFDICGGSGKEVPNLDSEKGVEKLLEKATYLYPIDKPKKS